MGALESVVTESQIRSLLIRERFYKDTGEWDKLRACYHPDPSKTWCNVSWYHGGIDGFLSGAKAMWDRGQGHDLIHNLNPREITAHGSRALAISTCQITTRSTIHDVQVGISSWIRVVTQLELADEKWKMLTLEVVYLRDSLSPAISGIPGNLPQEDLHVLQNARASYRCVIVDVHVHGHPPNGDLPGVDRPDTVREVLNRNYSWIAME